VLIPFNSPTWFFKLSRSDMWNSNDNRLIIKIFLIIFASGTAYLISLHFLS
jgi:hypothetical protein